MLKVNQMKQVIELVNGMLEQNLYEEKDPEARKQIIEYKNQMEEYEEKIAKCLSKNGRVFFWNMHNTRKFKTLKKIENLKNKH